MFFALSKGFIDELEVVKYERLDDIVAQTIPKYKWILVGMNMNDSGSERCVEQQLANLKKRNRIEENSLNRDYLKTLYNQYVGFITNELTGIDVWVFDYGNNEQDMCERVLKMVFSEILT